MASRSRSAAAPRTPGRSDCVRHASASFWPSLATALLQIAHSNSSAVAFLLRATARAFSSNSCTRTTESAPSINTSPSLIASSNNCVPERSSPSARAAIIALRIRRSEIESAPPNSLINNRSAVSRFNGWDLIATRANSKKGAIAGLPASACNWLATGIPTYENALRSADAVRPGLRKITAISL